MRKKLVLVISAIALIAVVSAGAFELGAHFGAPYMYTPMQNQAIGANIRVSGSKVPRNIRAVASKSDIAATDLQQASPIFDITPSGALPEPVTLTFPLGRQVTKAEAVFVATQESPNDSWTLISSKVSSDGWSVNVTTSHFSEFQTFWTSLGDGIATFKQGITDAVHALTSDVTTEATSPHCANDYYKQTTAQRENYLIGSSTRDTLYWCFGIENGHRVLKIVNRKPYPLDVSHPGFKLVHEANTTADLDQLARLVSGSQTVLFPFEEADYTVDMDPIADSQAIMTTSFASDAQSLYALQVGLSTAASLVTLLKGGKALTGAAKFYQMAKYMDIALHVQGCFNAVRQSSVGGGIGTLISNCFNTATLLKIFGKWGVILVVNFFVAPLVEFFRSEFSAAVDQATHGDLYKIIVARTGQLPTQGTGGTGGQPPTPPTVTPAPPHPHPTPTPVPPQSHPVNAYDNYGQSNLAGHAMCRGNPGNSLSMPGGTGTQTFTVPSGVATLSSAKVQIDPASVTAHMTISVNGHVAATAVADAVGDTQFSFGPVPVQAGDVVSMSITFTATYGKIITLYTVGNPGGTFTAKNTCPDGAPSFSTSSSGLRAVVSGMS